MPNTLTLLPVIFATLGTAMGILSAQYHLRNKLTLYLSITFMLLSATTGYINLIEQQRTETELRDNQSALSVRQETLSNDQESLEKGQFKLEDTQTQDRSLVNQLSTRLTSLADRINNGEITSSNLVLILNDIVFEIESNADIGNVLPETNPEEEAALTELVNEFNRPNPAAVPQYNQTEQIIQPETIIYSDGTVLDVRPNPPSNVVVE